jgi:type I restriction-modification system DNA methylase subunit/two-component sensor histidine kinase
MTLHGVIAEVLKESECALKPSEIAQVINKYSLYKTGDGNPVSVNQIRARINSYKKLFHINEDGSIKNANIGIRIYEQFVKRLSSLLHTELSTRDVELWVSVFTLIVRFCKIDRNQNDFLRGLGYKKFFTELLNKLNEEGRFKGLLTTLVSRLDRSYSEYSLERVYHLVVNVTEIEKGLITEEEFGFFFNDLVNDYYWQNKFEHGLYSTPKAVSRLISKIITPNDNDVILDPFAGKAGLVSSIINEHKNKRLNVIAGDINENCVLLGSLNLAVSSKNIFEYKERNALYDWEKEQEFADWVVMNPPFGTISSEDAYGLSHAFFSRNRDISGIAVQLALFHSKPMGKAIIVVPESFIFSDYKGIKGIKRHLIEKGLLHGVISLPAGIFLPYSNVKTSLLIIEKTISDKNAVYFYDASKIDPKEFELKIDDIVTSYREKLDVHRVSTSIEKNQIVESEFDLSITKYFTPKILFQKNNLMPIKEVLLNTFSGANVNINNINSEDGPLYISISDLPSESSELYLNLSLLKSRVSDLDLIKGTIRYIPENAILLAKVGTKLKPAIFNLNKKAVCNSNILVLQLDQEKVIPEYFVRHLGEVYFQEQIQNIRRGVGVPSFNQKDFLETFIEIPSLDEQKRVIASLQKLDSSSKEQTVDEELYNIISRINHELKTPISTIGMDAKSLFDFIKSLNDSLPITLNTLSVPLFEGQEEKDFQYAQIGVLLSRILSGVAHAQEVLGKAEETLKMGKTNLNIHPFAIKRFIETDILPFYSNANCLINIEGKDRELNFDKYQLKALFMNLIDNAVKHGFGDIKSDKENRIRILLNGLTSTKEYFEIIIANNGKPFGEGFTKEQFFERGSTNNKTKGVGFGGYHVRKIIENHDGIIELASDEETAFTEYKVQFKVYLPVKR